MMLTREEMIAVADRHYKHSVFGGRYDVAAIRKELIYGWGMNSMQAQREIETMREKAII